MQEQRQTYKHRDRQTYKHRDRQTQRQADRHTERKSSEAQQGSQEEFANRRIEGKKDRKKYWQTHIQNEKNKQIIRRKEMIDKYTEAQTQFYRHKDRHMYTHKCIAIQTDRQTQIQKD